jgi:hypothetical protein
MHFLEAHEHLKEGKRIRRKIWDKTLYLRLNEEKEVKAYIEECVPFNFTIDIINSYDWQICGEDVDLTFPEIIEPLKKGKNVKLKDWSNECKLESTPTGSEVYLRRIAVYDFTPTFACFSASDWEILE